MRAPSSSPAARTTRDVEPAAVGDLVDDPPRATLAWVSDPGTVRVAPVDARHADGTWHVAGDEVDAGLDGREVVLVVDDGVGWFELRALNVRGVATVGATGDAGIRPSRVVSWDYASLRPVRDDGPAAPRASSPGGTATTPRPARRAPSTVAAATGAAGSPPSAAELTGAARGVVDRARVLLLATVSPRSRPFCVPLWFVEHRGQFWMSTGGRSWSARNAAANPRVCLLFGGERDGEPVRVRVTGDAVCRSGLPPLGVLARLAVRYYLAPRRALGELRHARQWLLRQRYYSQTEGGAASLVVTPTAVDVLP